MYVALSNHRPLPRTAGARCSKRRTHRCQVLMAGGRPHADPARPVFYTHTLCPYAQRVALALIETGVEHDLVHIDLSNKPGWYRQVNPRGLVPAVEYGGQVRTESIDLAMWIAEEFVGGGAPLIPSDPYRQSEMRVLVDRADSLVTAGLSMMAGDDGRYWGIGKRGGREVGEEFGRAVAGSAFAKALEEGGGPFLLGEHVTVADLVYLPFMERFALGCREFRGGYDVGEVAGGRVGGWLDALQSRESDRRTAAEPAELLAAYRKYMSLDWFDYHTADLDNPCP